VAASVYTVSEKHMWGGSKRGIAGSPSGVVSWIGRRRTRSPGGAQKHIKIEFTRCPGRRGASSRLCSLAGKDAVSQPLTTSGKGRRSQMRLRSAIWGRKRIRLGTWARGLFSSPFGEQEGERRRRRRGGRGQQQGRIKEKQSRSDAEQR